MVDKTTVAWGGTIGSLLVTLVTNADRIAKVFGIINIPKDARETMTTLSSAPNYFSVGILAIGGACVVYLYSEHLRAVKRRFWNPKLDLLTVGLLGMVVFAGIAGVGLYRQARTSAAPSGSHDFAKNVSGPPIEWRFDKPVTLFWYSRKPGEAVLIEAIVINGTNKSGYALKGVKASIVADMQDHPFEMRVNPHGTYISPEESASLIPPGASFDLMLAIGTKGMSADDFLNQYSALKFIFRYTENGSTASFEEAFPRSYIEDQIAFIEEKTKANRVAAPDPRIAQFHAAKLSRKNSTASAVNSSITDDTAAQIARYWKLEDAIPKAKQLRERINDTGELYKKNVSPSGTPYNSVGWVQRWQHSIGEIAALSASVYPNSPVDLNSNPKLNYNIAAPGESEFKEDDMQGRMRYRTFYFSKESIDQQTNDFIMKMENEAATLRASVIKSAPSAP